MSVTEPAHAESDTAVLRLLDVARRQLGTRVLFLSRFSDHARTITSVAGEHPAVSTGRSDPLDDTFCQRIVEGQLPAVIPDARRDPDTAALPATLELSIGLHVGVPVRLSDGSLYGTLCGFDESPQPDAGWRDARVLRVIAQAIAELLEPEVLREREQARARAEVDRLLAAGDPHVVRQPIVQLADGATVATEALARFRHAPGVDTAEVFRRAEAVGAATALELAALAAVLAAAAGSPVPVSVNGSAALWCAEQAQPGLELCAERGWIVEITERQAVADYAQLNAALAPHREAGLRLAVDDTGAGFAGLQHLLALRPDFVKLDVVLVRGIEHDPQKQAIVAAMVAFAGTTGALLVAEGVETDGELSELRRLGVALGQGYLLARPT